MPPDPGSEMQAENTRLRGYGLDRQVAEELENKPALQLRLERV